MPNKRPPTIRDVAAAAGVSTAAVSKLLNNQQHFSPPVEERIRHAVATLGYRQNPMARGMITGRTKTVGFAVVDLRSPHFTMLAKGAHAVAAAHGYTLIVVDTQGQEHMEQHLLEALSWRVDGLIVSSRIPPDAVAWLAEQEKHLIAFGRNNTPEIPNVAADSVRSGYLMGRHFVERGFQRIAYAGLPGIRWNDERLMGIQQVLSESGRELTLFTCPQGDMEGGLAAGNALFADPRHFDAVIGATDLIALGLVHAARTMGLSLPQDVAIAGFDNIPYSRFSYPPLTTVDQCIEEMGGIAMQRLLASLDGQPQTGEHLVEPHLVIRESTTAAPSLG